MRKAFKLIFGIILLCSAAFAQFTTVSGTVTDPNNLPYAYGTITPQLVTNGSTPTLNGFPYSPPVLAVGLDATGSFTMQLAQSAALGGLTWNFKVCSAGATVQPAFGKGPVCFSIIGVTISGSSQSLTSTLTAAALPLTASFSGGSGLPLGCSNGQTTTFNGTSWTCSNAGIGTITGGGTSNFLPLFSSATGLANSPISTTGTVLQDTTQPFNVIGITSSNGAILGNAAPTACPGGGVNANFNTNLFNVGCLADGFTMNPPAATSGVAPSVRGINQYAVTLSGTPALAGVFGLGGGGAGAGGSPSFLVGVAGQSNVITPISGTVANAAGVLGIGSIGPGSSQSATKLYGVYGQCTNDSGGNGNITQPFCAALYAAPPEFSSGGTPVTSNVYGLYVDDQTAGGGTQNPSPGGIFTNGPAPSSFGGPLTLRSGSLTISALGSTTSAVCPNGTGGALTTVGCNATAAQPMTGFQDKGGQVFNIVAYGADPTGAVDFATAINAADAACGAAGGGTIYFPPGTYLNASQVNISQNNCTWYAERGTARITKGFNSGGFPNSASGGIVISGNFFTWDGIEYNCNVGSFTGLCINDTSNNHDVVIKNSYLHDGDIAAIALTCPNTNHSCTSNNGPNRVTITGNYISTPNTANVQGAILVLGTVTNMDIGGNWLDCSLSQSSIVNSPGCIQAESQGLTTALGGFSIHDNHIWGPMGEGAQANNGGWGLQIGPFNAYTQTDHMIVHNTFYLTGTSLNGWGISAEGIPNLILSGNIFDSQGFSWNYTTLEVFGDNCTITGNTFYTDNNSGTGTNITLITANGCTVAHNVMKGFGQTGGGSNLASGITVGGSHPNQAITSIAVASSVMTITTAATLSAWFQPGMSACITGTSQTADNICGLILNTNYSRSAGTLAIYNPAGVSATGGNLNSQDSNNDIADNTVYLPCTGTLSASSRFAILVRPQGTGEQAINNKVHDNTIVGCGAGTAGDVGVEFTGPGTSGGEIYQNKFLNLITGIIFGNASSGYAWNNTFSGVTTPMSGSAEGSWIIHPIDGANAQIRSGAGTSTLDGALGTVQQLACTGAGGIAITLAFQNFHPGQVLNFVFVQNATSACTVAYPATMHGGQTVSATLSSVSTQLFVMSNNGTDLYALSSGSTCTASCGTP